ncbi:phosphoglycerate dehydrogenase [Acetonema longum]|uniref:Phosphoglycerate dehydrogenase n=1 Tax=Acetonema longum DSM 6540 TaxID=1009370 RepID=F7NE26_9FIRM|nr:phosphoglycerate dehydrogenase [Acetonema longum]EGO65681.1 Phosphoglycerate dehydrogenase [Acetonema longum DSM 6540]
MNKKVLVSALSFRRSEAAVKFLQESGCELVLSQVERALKEKELLALLPGCAAIVAGNDEITDSVITASVPELRIIARSGVGYNTIDLTAAHRHGVAVTNTPGANSKSVADLTLGLMLALVRSIPRLSGKLHTGVWEKSIGGELGGKTLGIVGTGNVGREVMKRAQSFDMKIIAYDIYPRLELTEACGVVYLPLEQVLAQADFLSLHAPALPETVSMINRQTLALMKPTAFLINTARGDLVVEEDLSDALRCGRLAGAGLDAFISEPLERSCLFGLSNVILTPHIGASTLEASERAGLIAAEEVARVLQGLAPLHSVR